MVSAIDPTKPTTTHAFTADMRANFAAAKAEIEALQASMASLQAAYGSINPQVDSLGSVTAATLTLDFTTTRIYALTIASPTIALTVHTSTAPGVLVTGLIAITQDATGSRDMTFPASFRWQGGFAPSLSLVPGSTDIVQISTLDAGATWFAAIALQAPP